MTPEQRGRVEDLYQRLQGLARDQREAVLQQLCPDDAEVRAEVSRLAGTRLEAAATPDVQADVRGMLGPLDHAIGTFIGPYKLLSVLGEGGFGIVYLAERREPMVQRVALKVIKPGMDSRAVLGRFEAERQALALMDHPNIAHVYDAGATATTSEGGGRPYFVMEHVAGVPITEHCDKERLTIRQRLELFGVVCDAVAHAHMKGIIHRDIKPSNILVSVRETGEGIPKIIDFGVAKATQMRLTQHTVFTETGQLIGTPEYMSPEQAEMTESDIDTRSDVYSLGVVLYELLTGALPFEPGLLRAAGVAAIQKIIREKDPPRPSTRLTTLGAAGASVLAARRTRLADLAAELRRELEWIPLKALRKERTERYRSASELGDDVANYLGQRALIAGPESAGYRVRKFVRRNKGAVAAGAAIAATLVLATGVSVWFGVKAVAAEGETRKRADELQKVSDFQAQMLAQVDPTQAGMLLTKDVTAKFEEAISKSDLPEGERASQVQTFAGQWRRVNATDAARDLIDRTILKPAVEAIDKQFKGQPVVDAALRQVLADRYRGIGLSDAALPLQERALAIRRRELGEEHKETLTSMNNLGDLWRDLGKPNEAEPYYREALDKRRRVLGEEHPNTLTSLNNMGNLLRDQGKTGEVERYVREALDKRRRVLGEEHPDTLTSINNMGYSLREQGKLTEAAPYYREALEKRRRVLGDEHPNTLSSINNMGSLLRQQGKLGEAEPYLLEALETRRRVLGEEHPNTLTSMNSMGTLLQDQEKLAEAEPYLREALEKRRRVLGEEHAGTLASINNLAYLLNKQGKVSEAEPLYREALDKLPRVMGEDHPGTLVAIYNLGCLLLDQGKFSEAEPYLREALEKRRRVLGAEHPNTLGSINSMGSLYVAQEKHAMAAELLAPAEPATRAAFTGDNAYRLGDLLVTLGKARTGLGEFVAAETNLLEAHSIFVMSRGPTHTDTRDCGRTLADLYSAWHAVEPGKGYEARSAEWRAGAHDGVETERKP